MGIRNYKSALVPAICTQCSARIEVDASLDAAICKHCGTAYIVEKAIAQYSVQELKNTHIDHIETINIHHNSESAKPKGFFDRSLDRWAQVQIEREKRKAEAARLEAEREKQELKYLPLVLIASVVMFIVLLLIVKQSQ